MTARCRNKTDVCFERRVRHDWPSAVADGANVHKVTVSDVDVGTIDNYYLYETDVVKSTGLQDTRSTPTGTTIDVSPLTYIDLLTNNRKVPAIKDSVAMIQIISKSVNDYQWDRS